MKFFEDENGVLLNISFIKTIRQQALQPNGEKSMVAARMDGEDTERILFFGKTEEATKYFYNIKEELLWK